MYRILSLVLTVLVSVMAPAQPTTIAKARKALSCIMDFKGDSVYADLSVNAKSMITPLQLNTLWYTFTLQYGKFAEAKDWKELNSMGYDIATCRLVFEKGELNYTVTYRSDIIEGLVFQPVPEQKIKEAESCEKYTEEKMDLCCDGYTMPAILTLPTGISNPPCVIIVHGSGPSDMDGNIGKTSIYKDIAHKLAEHGIATFRYHKRTFVYKEMPDSLKDKLTVNYETTDDAVAAARMLKEYTKTDFNGIFILGHSQGAMMIPRIAQTTDNADGFIMLSAPARKLPEMVMEQMEYLHSISMNPAWQQIKPEMEKQIANFKKYGTEEFDKSIPTPLNLPVSYLLDLQNYDQIEEASKITAPLFILNGEGDYQVTMEDFNMWKKALKGKDNVTFKSYKGLNHVYTPSSVPPSPEDYNKEATFSENVINDIAKWINSCISD